MTTRRDALLDKVAAREIINHGEDTDEPGAIYRFGILPNGQLKVTLYDPAGNYVDVAAAMGLSFRAGRSANATNIYLRDADGVPSNLSPYILPFDAYLIGISASTDGAETWTAEVHKELSLISGATLDITAADSGQRSDLEISLNAGDEINLYCNGTAINRPTVTVFFKKR